MYYVKHPKNKIIVNNKIIGLAFFVRSFPDWYYRYKICDTNKLPRYSVGVRYVLHKK